MSPPPTTDAGSAPDDHEVGPGIDPEATVERIQLDEHSWVDVHRGWLLGQEQVAHDVLDKSTFTQARLFRYERSVDEPRLTTWCVAPRVPHPALIDAQRAIGHRYHARFDGFALAWYRDGRDSVAFHRDSDMRWTEDTIIAILTLGVQRPFLLRPKANRNQHHLAAHGATHDLAPAGGDLLVMGGRCQIGWEHAVPKVPTPIGARISAQWRWTSRRGRPERGPAYRAPVHFSR